MSRTNPSKQSRSSRSQSSSVPGRESEPSAFERAMDEMRHQPAGAYPDVPAGWLLKAVLGTLAAIVVLAWLLFCWVFWQGSWQLLYHPVAAVTRTPASAG